MATKLPWERKNRSGLSNIEIDRFNNADAVTLKLLSIKCKCATKYFHIFGFHYYKMTEFIHEEKSNKPLFFLSMSMGSHLYTDWQLSGLSRNFFRLLVHNTTSLFMLLSPYKILQKYLSSLLCSPIHSTIIFLTMQEYMVTVFSKMGPTKWAGSTGSAFTEHFFARDLSFCLDVWMDALKLWAYIRHT